MAEIMRFLDEMDATRDLRLQGRSNVWQMNGYRREWNAYMDEWADDNADWQ